MLSRYSILANLLDWKLFTFNESDHHLNEILNLYQTHFDQ